MPPAQRLTRVLTAVAPRGLPLLRAAARRELARAFGPPPFDASAAAGDPGLFGPGSSSWRLLAEPAAIVGGLRGLLVQLRHPLAVAGVADHSRFRADPLRRLHQTSTYVTTTAFGSTQRALAAAATVRQAHRAVVGTAPDGRPYDAAAPPLLTWVSVALTSSFLAADLAYAPCPLDAPAADGFVAEQSRAAALLDPRVDLEAFRSADGAGALRRGDVPLPLLEEGWLPRDTRELEARIAAFAPELDVGEQARSLLRFLLWPPLDARLRAGYLPLLAAAVATLDAPTRRQLGLPAGRALPAALGVQSAGVLTLLRLALGTSPAARAAAARASQQPGQRARR